ncbi:hypothetical protein BGZ94_003946 [Podila epigama]|nr:hypothetical protein BGZ94_003946 [Podila epigama]
MASIPIPRRFRSIVYIPSKSDGNMLEVCISMPTTVSPTRPQVHTGVVIAHPYGPLGGSYNNNVVGSLLQWFETFPLQVARNDDNVSRTASSHAASASASKRKNSTVTNSTKTSVNQEKEQGKQEDAAQSLSSSESVSSTTEGNPASSESQPASRSAKPKNQTSGSHPDSLASHIHGKNGPDSKSSRGTIKVYDESGNEIETPRLPYLSRFILSGFSYGGLIASSIPPPLRDPTDPQGPRLPTSYIFVSYPAGVAWFLTSGAHGSFAKRAKAILHRDSVPVAAETSTNAVVDAYFIIGSQDQFTSPKTLLSWLKTNTGLDTLPQVATKKKIRSMTATSWIERRPAVIDSSTVQVDVLEGVDHFWLDREQDLLDRLQAWWTTTHPSS